MSTYVKCKGAGDYHKQYYDKKPVVQVDYSFVTQKLSTAEGEEKEKGKTLSATILSAVDVTTGMVSSCVVKEKGPNDYAVNELQRFVLEVGRSQGVLQSDQEPAIKLLCRDVAAKIGITTRLSPVNSKQSQGIIEKRHRDLHKAIKVFKETILMNYGDHYWSWTCSTNLDRQARSMGSQHVPTTQRWKDQR